MKREHGRRKHHIKHYVTHLAFTLIELLIVIAVIALMSSVILISVIQARGKAKVAKAQSDLHQLYTAVNLMSIDTGVWPNGCAIDQVFIDPNGNNNEVTFDMAAAGLLSKPPVGTTDSSDNCAWTQAEVNNWRGPYIKKEGAIDPWGNYYWFDQDYFPHRDCPSYNANPAVQVVAAIVSEGADGISIHDSGDLYNCDDVYLSMPGTPY